jgi:hypothetical protein
LEEEAVAGGTSQLEEEQSGQQKPVRRQGRRLRIFCVAKLTPKIDNHRCKK